MPAPPTPQSDTPGPARPDDAIIRVEGLTKTFGRVHALAGLDLAVRRGEVHGFLGPNGSGKSTTIRILLGLLRATGGTAEVFGADPWRHAPELHRRLAYVPGDVALWPGLSGGQCLDVLGKTHGGLDRRRKADLVDRFELDLTKRARDFSKGNRQKVALVAALAANAELLVLDEPTSGLDPLMEQAFQNTVREAQAGGATVLLSSHILAEVEALADRVSIIRSGRTVTTGTLADLRRHTRTAVHALAASAPRAVEKMPGVERFEIHELDEGFDITLSADPQQLADVIGALHAAGIRSLTCEPPSLDELFLRAYSDAPTAGDGSGGPADAATGSIGDSDDAVFGDGSDLSARPDSATGAAR